MRNFKFWMVATACMCLPTAGFASVIYGAAANDNLYTIVPAAGTDTLTLIGNTGVQMADIAAFNGVLWGISLGANSELYRISTTNAAITAVGLTGDQLNALVFGSDGTLYAAGTDSLYTIDPATGAATLIGSGSGAGTYNSSGDLEFVGSTLYLTSLPASGNDQLFSINTATGQGTHIGTNLGFTDVFGLAEFNGTLYGFTNTGAGTQNVLTVNPATGVATALGTYTPGFNGTAELFTPEPAMMGLVGIALVGLGALRFRLKR